MPPKLISQVFLREDLEAILQAIYVASLASGNSPHDAARRQGFAQAIIAVAVAVHVEPPALVGRDQFGAYVFAGPVEVTR